MEERWGEADNMETVWCDKQINNCDEMGDDILHQHGINPQGMVGQLRSKSAKRSRVIEYK